MNGAIWLMPWVEPTRGDISKFEIVEHLRRHEHLSGFVDEFTIEDSQCVISFKGPGYSADAFIHRADGSYEITLITEGWVAIANDLHKGRHTGPVWSWVIDITAALLILVSLTGLGLLLYIKRRRLPAIFLAAAGAAVCLWLFKAFV